MRIQLWCAAGQVECFESQVAQAVDNQLNRALVHDLTPVWSGSDMAMQALLIALIAQIHLKRVGVPAANRGEVGRSEVFEGVVHVLRAFLPKLTG